MSQGAGMGYLPENTDMASRIFRSNAVHIVNVLSNMGISTITLD